MKKFAADKIAFLGLLVLALVLAQIVVSSRTGVKMSGPITIDNIGLTVKIPSGNNWKSTEKWNFARNKYIISSHFVHPVYGQKTAEIMLQYFLAIQSETTSEIYQQKATKIGGKIIESGSYPINDATLNVAMIQNQQDEILIYAAVELPQNRKLEIELIDVTGEITSAKKVFQETVNSIKFQDNQLLRNGAAIAAQLKEKGIDSFFDSRQGDCFLIKNDNENMGFTLNLLKDTKQEGSFSINARTVTFLNNIDVQVIDNFQSDSRFESFSWEKNINSHLSLIMVLDKSGMLNVRKYFPGSEQYATRINPAAIPDVFLKQVFIEMLKSGHEEILIDIIETASGTVTPALITKIETGDEFEHALLLRMLDDQKSFQKFYFDQRMNCVKNVQSTNVVLEKTTAENIKKLFPKKISVVESIIKDF